MNLNKYMLMMLSAVLFAAASVSARAAGPSDSDKEFVKKAAIIGTAEVRAGKLAADKTTSADVRDFAAMMVSDHTKANEELKTLASKKGIPVPAELDEDHRELIAKLDKKSGKAFDEAYSEAMKDGHEDAVKLFEKQAKKSDDPELQAFAQKTLPTLMQHMQHAERLADTHD